MSEPTNLGAAVNTDAIKSAVNDRLKAVRKAITEARASRENINNVIKLLVAEEAELARVANSFKPRTRKPKP